MLHSLTGQRTKMESVKVDTVLAMFHSTQWPPYTDGEEDMTGTDKQLSEAEYLSERRM